MSWLIATKGLVARYFKSPLFCVFAMTYVKWHTLKQSPFLCLLRRSLEHSEAAKAASSNIRIPAFQFYSQHFCHVGYPNYKILSLNRTASLVSKRNFPLID